MYSAPGGRWAAWYSARSATGSAAGVSAPAPAHPAGVITRDLSPHPRVPAPRGAPRL